MTPVLRASAAATVAGATLALAFAPIGWFPLAFVAPAVLMACWRGTTPGRAALYGYLFGLGLFGAGVSWVYVTLNVFGNLSPPLAVIATFLFVSLSAAVYAALGYVQTRLFGRYPESLRLLLVLPAMWVLFEWIRGWILTGFPWLNLGYSQMLTPLRHFAPAFGVYGVGLAVILTTGWLLYALPRWRDRSGQAALAGVIALWITGWAVGQVAWAEPAGRPIKVALVQGNVPLANKWQPAHRRRILQDYLQLSQQSREADLVVWPEGAVPTYLQYLNREYLSRLRHEAREYHTDFLFGVVELDENDHGTYYNSVASIGSHEATYRKRHLVPFGEYPPLEPMFRWLMKAMRIPMADFSEGPSNQPPLQAAGQTVAVSICYENVFGEELLDFLPAATLLVNVSENAWYGRSLAAPQLVEMARMRAIETARPVLRVDNAGPSVVIDHSGRVLKTTPQFQQMVLKDGVQPMAGTTLYARWGNYAVLLLLAGFLLTAWILNRRRG